MTIKLPKIIGHRGACGYAPENTIESVQTAADMDVEWVELDVKLTKDDIPIIFHDDTLERTTNGSGLVAETLYEDIQQLEAGSWYADSFAGVKIPTLEEMCEVLVDLNLGLNLEIKPCPGREKETAEVALDHLSRIWDDHERLIISSFSHVSLETAQDMAGGWYRGLLIEGEMPENWKDMADYLDLSIVSIDGNTCTREAIESISDMEYAVLARKVSDSQRARQLYSWGVDAISTDVPDVIKETILTVH